MHPFYTLCVLLIASGNIGQVNSDLPLASAMEMAERWDAALHTDVFHCIQLLAPLIQYSERYKTNLLIQTHPLVTQRVLDLYIAEYQFALHKAIATIESVRSEPSSAVREETDILRRRTCERQTEMLAQSLERHGNQFEELAMHGPWRNEGEAEAEFQELLASIAESTFDPRIYEEVWNFPVWSPLHIAYLATVRPAETIERFAHVQAGFELNGETYAPDTIFLQHNGAAFSVHDAFDLLAHLAQQHPAHAGEQSEVFREFVETYALHYAPKKDSRYRERLDYLVRYRALEILAEIGRTADISLIKRLSENPPERRPGNFRSVSGRDSSISALADACMEAISRRTVL